MKKKITIFSFLFLTSFAMAQDNEEFKPSGKPFVKVYTNFHSSTTNNETHNAFEITRAYFGYAYNLNNKFSGKLTLDVGNPKAGGLEMTAYLKNAYIQYKSNRITAKFGLIGLSQFGLQEKLWGGRYLYKSFQDQYKFGSSADLGLNLSYKLHGMASVDLTIANGEGYKKLEADSLLKYSLGLTLHPVKGLILRTYYDYLGSDNAQQTLSFYAAYSTERFKIGAEYNQQIAYNMVADENWSGFSLYASYKLEKVRYFGRFDQLSSATITGDTDPWNYASDGQAVIAGVEFSPAKGLKITPNYQAWIPADGSAITHSAYLSCEISF